MSVSETLLRYVRTAEAAGTEVYLLPPAALPDLLAEHLSRIFKSSGSSTDSKDLSRAPGPMERLAAVPATGWPEGLRALVEAALRSTGCGIVSEKEVRGRFEWDRDSLAKAVVGITFSPAFLADTGSVVMLPGPGMGTLAGLLPEVHIAISLEGGCRSDLARYLDGEGLPLPSRITLVSGPSRTGDIEGTMTTGVHGPGRVVHLILTGPEGASGDNSRG